MQTIPEPDAQAVEDDSKPIILLVDDDIAILDGVADLLELSGYEVMTAQDGQLALEALSQQVPDLIVSDIMMPDMDGYALFEAVRSTPEWTTIPFIFLTARGQRTDIRLGNRLGADHYIVKPFEPEDLLSAVSGRLKRMRDIDHVVRSDVERMKQQLITIFSHELRTPLTYIYGYVNLLQEDGELMDNAARSSMLDGIQKGAERLVSLVEDLMLMIRLDSGVAEMEIALRREPIDIKYMIGSIFRNLEEIADDRQVTLVSDIDVDLQVDGVLEYLKGAVQRLIDNGIKFSKREGGVIEVKGKQDGDMVIIEVSDEGIGIDETNIQNIFDRFQQVNRDILEQQGIGLGLTLAQEVIQLHGGSIDVKSAVGQGTTFILTLPRYTSQDF